MCYLLLVNVNKCFSRCSITEPPESCQPFMRFFYWSAEQKHNLKLAHVEALNGIKEVCDKLEFFIYYKAI